MTLRINRLNWLLGSAALVAPMAFAQPAPEVEAEARQETVVVTATPILDSQIAAIFEKRNAPNLVDVVAADAVGRFPDQNAAAALSRLPAVAVQRDQGQERYVQVRGAPNRWVAVSIDGVTVVGVDEGGVSRAFRFDAIPAVLLQSAAVNKSLTSDLTAEAVVANVNLRSYSPLADEGFRLQGEFGVGTMDLGQGNQEQSSLRASWSNDRIGAVVGFSQYGREQVTDNREVGAYDALGATEIDARNYQLKRENNGAFAGVEFAATENLTVFAKAIFSEFVDDEDRDQYEFRLSNAASGTRTPQGGELGRTPVRASFNLANYRTEYEIYTLGADWEGDLWDASFRLNQTNSDNTTNLPLVQLNTSSSTAPFVSFDLSEPEFPRVQLFTSVAGTTPGTFARGTPITALNTSLFNGTSLFIPVLQDSFSESQTAKADVTRRFDNFSVTGGVELTERELDGFTFAASNFVVLNTLPAVGLTFNPGDYATTQPWKTNFPLGPTTNEIDNRRLRNDVEGFLDALQAAGRYNPANNVPPENFYDLDERLIAAYGQAAFTLGDAEIVAGLRVENFTLDSTGTVRIAGGAPQTLTVSQDYTDLFPSLNVRYSVSDKIVARAGVMRGLARPSFGEVRVGASINDTATPGTIGGGNPTLEPEYTWGFDGSLEYYPNEASILAVSVFSRWVDQVLYTTTAPVGSAAFNSGGVDRSNYLLTSSFNGLDGQLIGVEMNYLQQFDFLPGWLAGFGFQGNVTFLDGSFDTVERKGISFPGTSDTVINTSVFYELYGLSARVSYQYRSDWTDTIGGLGTGSSGDEIREGYENLDVSLRYALNDNITLFGDFANLTNATYIAYQGTPDRPTEVEEIGWRSMIGLRVNF